MNELHRELADVLGEIFDGPAAEECTVGQTLCAGIFGSITPLPKITDAGFYDGVSTSLRLLRSRFGIAPIRGEKVTRHETGQTYEVDSVITDDPLTYTLVLSRVEMRVF